MQSSTLYCLKCGAANDPQMPYCIQCGTALSGNVSQTGSDTVIQNRAPIAPPPPPTTYGTVSSAPPVVSAYSLDPYTQSTQQAPQKKSGNNSLLIASVIVALVLVVGSFIAFRLIVGSSTSTVKHTSTPMYPTLAPAYAGNVHNNNVNTTSTLTLTNVVEDAQGNISGNALISSPLAGSGPFKGSVGTDKSVQFTITPNDNSGVSTIGCTGTIAGNGSMSGTYTVTNTGETGTWKVK